MYGIELCKTFLLLAFNSITIECLTRPIAATNRKNGRSYILSQEKQQFDSNIGKVIKQ